MMLWVVLSTEHLSSKRGMSLQAESSQSEPRVVTSWESCPERWFAPLHTWGQLCRKEQRAFNWIRGFQGWYSAGLSVMILSTKNSPKGSFLIAFCLFTYIKKTAWLFWEYVSLENIQQTAWTSNILSPILTISGSPPTPRRERSKPKSGAGVIFGSDYRWSADYC